MKRLALASIAVFLVVLGAVSVAQPRVSESDYDLLGKPAPTFTLDLVGGGKLDLAAHKGKDIVVLDFWATWCPPCRISLPLVVQIMDEYKAKAARNKKDSAEKTGVVFYGVNQKESESDVRAFFDKMKIEFPVALDAKADVAKAYGVPGFPTSVIIGKDGTVQAVHIGVAPDLEDKLRIELDTLLAGKTLVTPKPEK